MILPLFHFQLLDIMKSLIINFLLSNAIGAQSFVAMNSAKTTVDRPAPVKNKAQTVQTGTGKGNPKDTVIIKSKGKSRVMIINEGANDWKEFRAFDWNNLMRDVDSLMVRKGSLPNSFAPMRPSMKFDTTISIDAKGNKVTKVDTTYGLMLFKSGPGNYTFQRFEVNPIMEDENLSIFKMDDDDDDDENELKSINGERSRRPKVEIRRHHKGGHHSKGRGNYRSYMYRFYGDENNRSGTVVMPPLPGFYENAFQGPARRGDKMVTINSFRFDSTKKAKKVELVTDFDINFGLNNYLQNGKIPSGEQYGLSPLGSRYFSLRLMQGWRFNNKYRVAVGAEIAWNNYMFDEDVMARSSSTGVEFISNSALGLPPFAKSKMTTTFLNIPVIFRARITKGLVAGVGGYAGYRVYSYRKIEYGDNNKSVKERNRDDFNLNDIQYGLRGELGFKNVDIFCNYNLSPLFKSGQGPQLTPFSFGIQF